MSWAHAAAVRSTPQPVGRLVAEPVAGKRRAHHVEGVGRVAPVGHRVGQGSDDLEELDDRPGPAVGEDQG